MDAFYVLNIISNSRRLQFCDIHKLILFVWCYAIYYSIFAYILTPEIVAVQRFICIAILNCVPLGLEVIIIMPRHRNDRMCFYFRLKGHAIEPWLKCNTTQGNGKENAKETECRLTAYG